MGHDVMGHALGLNLVRMLYPAALLLVVLSPDLAYAKASPIRTVTAAILPSPSLPQLSPHEILGGCGRGRVRDAATHLCRGPGE
jgi:hypothetical protein